MLLSFSCTGGGAGSPQCLACQHVAGVLGAWMLPPLHYSQDTAKTHLCTTAKNAPQAACASIECKTVVMQRRSNIARGLAAGHTASTAQLKTELAAEKRGLLAPASLP